LAVMDDALVNARGEIVDLTPEDSYATIDICDIDFSFLDDKNIVCGLCGEVVAYSTLFSGHLSRVHPEMLDPDMMIGQLPYVEYLKRKLESDRKNIQNGFKWIPSQCAVHFRLSKQTLFRRTPRKVSQIRINPSEMTLPQLEVALKKKLMEKMGRRVKVSLVDKEHVKCGLCNSVISINKKFEIVHVVRHFNAWHPTNHQCAGQWQKRTQRPGVGKPLSKQDFAVIDLSHTQPDNLQCIWCGMFIDATTIAVHFTECHPGEVEVPKCLLCIQELVINARVIEKFGSDFDIVLRDEFHIKVGKLNKLFTSESLMDNVRDSVVVHTTAIPGDDDSVDDMDDDVLQTNSRQVFGRHNRPKRSMVQPIYRQAPPTNSEYVTVVSDSHWKCKICDADLYGAVISACRFLLSFHCGVEDARMSADSFKIFYPLFIHY
uniref:C2H2-type domain-containing protein n=1 Tax=Heligmosomoides polygyrus TaxID=6339 RepID=A0A183GQK9_HELPZ